MKRPIPIVLVFALFFLFFIQMAGTLIQSIYVLDLMNLSLDARVLGVLFFFTPVLLLFFPKKLPEWLMWTLAVLFLVARGLTPSLLTAGRLLTSGLAVGTSLLLLPFLLTAKAKGEAEAQMGLLLPAGLALGVGLSVFLRTVNFSLDSSLTPTGAWIGWLLCITLAWSLTRLEWGSAPEGRQKSPGVTAALVGIILILTLVYFAFSAPAVIARWTEGNYPAIVGLVSLLALAAAFLFLRAPRLLGQIPRRGLILWNILFALSLLGTILAHRVSFPAAPNSPVVVVGGPAWWQQIPLYGMLLLFPVIFVDMHALSRRIREARPSPQAMAPGLLLGGLALVLLIFMNIFTNVWGYVAPVSPPFRNKFWLPYLLITGVLSLVIWLLKPGPSDSTPLPYKSASWDWAAVLAFIFTVTLIYSLSPFRFQSAPSNRTQLMVETYNIQQGNDTHAQQSYDRQLALIQSKPLDILALQETDTARISMNNDDYVRYFAAKLGYYSYYGPTTVTGTFGTAILSRYPLKDTRSVFSYSDTDEIGTSEATIEVGGRTFSLHDVHPDGSAAAKMIFAQTLLERCAGETYVIILGDFNLRAGEPAYEVVAAQYIDVEKSLYPQADNEMIDHIFVSGNLKAHYSSFLQTSNPASDHPAHVAQISW